MSDSDALGNPVDYDGPPLDECPTCGNPLAWLPDQATGRRYFACPVCTNKTKIHTFEEAGLGKAPFKCIADYWSHDQRACDYCGTCIHQIFVIKSADARTFIVGSVCVFKTEDRGLIDIVRRALEARRIKQQHERADARIEAALKLLTNENVQHSLKSLPHPNEFLAGRGRSLFDYIDYLLEHAGRAGRLRAAKIIEREAERANS